MIAVTMLMQAKGPMRYIGHSILNPGSTKYGHGTGLQKMNKINKPLNMEKYKQVLKVLKR